MKKPLFLLSVAAALLVEGASLDEYKWLASATEGDFNDPANWAKTSDARYNYPQAGCLSYFYDMKGNWTVKIPSGMADDASYTLARNLKNGSRLVFDATKATWRKVRPADTPWYGDKVFVLEHGHGLPLLGINADKSEKGRHGMAFDGLMTFDVANTGYTLTFAKGSVFNVREFDAANPELNPAHTAQLFRDNSTTYNKIVFEPETKSYWYNLNFDCRSDSGFNTLRIEGGEHRVDNDFSIKSGITQASTGIVEMVSGKFTVAKQMWFDRLAEVRLSGDSEMKFGTQYGNAQMFVPYNHIDETKIPRAPVRIALADKASLNGTVLSQRAQNSDLVFQMQDQSSVSLGNTANFAQNSNSTTLLEMSGASAMTNFNLNVANGADTRATVVLADQTQFVVRHESRWAQGANSYVSFTLRDQAIFRQTDAGNGWNAGKVEDETAVIDINLEGGSVVNLKDINFAVAPASKVRFAGSSITMPNLTIKRTTTSSESTYRPDVALTAGTVTLSGTASFDALDATGGHLTAKTVTGGSDADVLFDGTVVSPYVDSQVLISGIATAKVGATGLVLDPAGKTTTLDQVFTDAEEGVGRVCPQGAGMVKVRQPSAHATTELAGATLGFDGMTGSVTFGKNLVFAGGTLDLTGTTGLTCQTLTVGDARGFVAFTMEEDGEYPLLTVTDGVSLDVVRRIRVHVEGDGHRGGHGLFRRARRSSASFGRRGNGDI